MTDIIVIFVLLCGVIALTLLAGRLQIPYPILLVMGGLTLGFIPGLPAIQLRPELVFLLFLPPLLYSSAWQTSWRDFWQNRRPIGLLAIGLVITTTLLVGIVAHIIIPGLPWAVAFTLGAIVSPTDAVAATSIARRLGVPRRLVTVIEGEGLVNDASGLVAFRIAVAAVATGSFSLVTVGVQFVVVSLGGIAIGLLFGLLAIIIERYVDNPPVEIAISLLFPFAAYIAADTIQVSGVLSVVTAGIFASRQSARTFSASSRIQAYAVWQTIEFIFNGLLFLLTGLQLRTIIDGIGGRISGQLFWQALAVSLAVILARIIWMFPATYLPRLLIRTIERSDPAPPWQYPMILAWAGMRGGVSLAAALSLPITINGNQPFPERELLLFLTFITILTTLVFQGLTLPPLIRRLGLHADTARDHEERAARFAAANAGMAYLETLTRPPNLDEHSFVALRSTYEHRLHRFAEDGDEEEAQRDSAFTEELLRIRRALVAVERETLIKMRDDGKISDEVLRSLEYEMDIRELLASE